MVRNMYSAETFLGGQTYDARDVVMGINPSKYADQDTGSVESVNAAGFLLGILFDIMNEDHKRPEKKRDSFWEQEEDELDNGVWDSSDFADDADRDDLFDEDSDDWE